MGDPNPDLVLSFDSIFQDTNWFLLRGWVTESLPVPHWERVSIKSVSQNLAGMGFEMRRILEGPFSGALEGHGVGNVQKSRLRADCP